MNTRKLFELCALVAFFVSLSQFPHAESEWKPNDETVNKLISLKAEEISKSFFELVPENERVEYALGVSVFLISQRNDIDKAERLLEIANRELSSRDNTEQHAAVYLLRMAVAERRSDHLGAIKFGNKVIEFVRQKKEYRVEEIVPPMRSIIYASYTLGDFKRSLEMSKELITEATRFDDKALAAEANFSAAEAYYRMNVLDEAERSARTASVIYGELGDNEGLGHAEKVLGNVYMARHRFADAIKSFQLAINYYKKVNDAHGLANCNFNLGLVFKQLAAYEKAEESLADASFYFIKSGSPGGSGMAKMELGNVHVLQGDFEKAQIFFRESRDLLVKMNYAGRLAQLLTYEGDMHARMGNVEQAKNAYQQALNFFESTGNTEYSTILREAIDSLPTHVWDPNGPDSLPEIGI